MTGFADFAEQPRFNSGMPAVPDTHEKEELFELYHDRIWRYVLHLVKDCAEAEDLTQDVFLRAYRRWDSLRDSQAVRGWLYRIATNVCLDRLRQRRLQQLSTVEESHDGPQPRAAIPQADEIVEREETSLCVQRCLDFLPDHYRAVILLYEAHSLTASEIAQLLGTRVTTVKIRLHRARRRLQKIMQCGCVVSNDNRGNPVCEAKS